MLRSRVVCVYYNSSSSPSCSGDCERVGFSEECCDVTWLFDGVISFRVACRRLDGGRPFSGVAGIPFLGRLGMSGREFGVTW